MNSETSRVPLCVDLDNTLVRTNTLMETIVGVLRQNPALIFLIPFWAIRGQAYLWAALVDRFRPNPSFLPYSDPVLGLVRGEVASGRAVILATGAHERMAQDVASHLGLFTGVFSTHGTEHMVACLKADALTATFGLRGFDYVGDSLQDMAVFRCCQQAYVVSPSPRLAERLKRESFQTVWICNDAGVKGWFSLVSAVRPSQ